MHSAFWQLGKILIRELFLGLQTMDKCVHLVAGDSAESFLITPRPLLSRSWAVVPSSTTRLITLTTLTNIIINQINITALVVNHSPYHSLSPLTALTRQHHHQQDHHHRRLHKKSLGKLPMPKQWWIDKTHQHFAQMANEPWIWNSWFWESAIFRKSYVRWLV